MVLIQEKIHDYRQKLDDIRDRIIRVSPDKWVDDEIEDSDCSGEFDFDEGDITPAKGSVSKIEKKRLIFDMLRDLNSILQSKLKIGSLKKSQIIGIQKIHEGIEK